MKRRCDIVLCFTTRGKLGETAENRVRVASNLRPELTSLNAGSLNFALFHITGNVHEWKCDWEKPYLEGTEDFIFPKTFKTMCQYLEIIYANGAKPEPRSRTSNFQSAPQGGNKSPCARALSSWEARQILGLKENGSVGLLIDKVQPLSRTCSTAGEWENGDGTPRSPHSGVPQASTADPEPVLKK